MSNATRTVDADLPKLSESGQKHRIAFFGTSDRSLPLLESLNSNFDLVLCVTKRDTKVGRHQELRETEVKKWAKVNHIMTISVSSLKGAELEAVIEQLKSSNVEYGVVADFSFIIPYQLIELFDGKLINIHFSLLPLYRGASPVQFTILNGDQTTGITYHLIDKKMDSGRIIHQIGYKLANNEMSGQLYNILFELASKNLAYVIKEFHEGQMKPRAQDENLATYTYSPSHPESTFIYKEDAKINWKGDNKKIESAVRAFNPWPIEWTAVGELENNKKLWLPKLKLREGIDKKLKIKVYKAGLIENGKLELKEVQLEGKNKVDWKTFENGYVEQQVVKRPKKVTKQQPSQQPQPLRDSLQI